MLYCVFLVGFVLITSCYCQTDTSTLELALERISKLEKQLEFGGKQYENVQSLNSALQLKDHDYLRLQFLGAKQAWLGCPFDTCDLRRCPSKGDKYRHFDTQCGGETFQIFNDGAQNSPIKCGQRIRLRYLFGQKNWVGCPLTKKHCDKSNCPGTTSNAKNFNRCGEEIFIIYARGRNNGEVIYNGDVVMLYFPPAGKYVSIQGVNQADATSINFCPGVAPPAYLSYGICSKNAFRIYRKP